ncbi:MAG: NADH-quinone oxidoreductase subunit N, partial [Ignavibacteriaceae bacterium]|nr:NADH-quinone oxidoreductase subunit N [Ignavibacteriaceae bacterium]
MIYLSEVYNIIPLIIIGAGIIISVIIELYSHNGKTILPWFSFLLFLGTGFYSLIMVENQSVVFQNMLSTGGITNIFYFIFNIGAA